MKPFNPYREFVFSYVQKSWIFWDSRKPWNGKPKSLKNAPEFKGTLGITHTAAIAGGVLTSRLDLSFEDESYNLVANAPESAEVDVDTLINARIAYQPDNGNWQLALWGKNLSDEEYARASAERDFSQYAAEPLTWGVDFGYRF